MAGPDGGGKQDVRPQIALFGREREFATLRRAYDDACGGDGRLVLISGEAGIGKTSLVRALSEVASDEDAHVHASACYDLSVTPPYRVWIDIFSTIGRQINLPPLPASPDEPPPEWASSQDALFSEAIEILSEAAREHPRLLILEDLHWTDSASLEFLRYAARQVRGLPVLIVVTYRDTEIDRQHPFHLHLPALIRESDATRISLRPLDDAGIASLLQQRYQLPTGEQNRLLNYLQQRTEGNPFFIEEILRTLEESGVIIDRDDDQWSLGDLRQTPVPALVQQVIDRRLEQAEPSGRRLLAIAAAIDQEFSIDIWRQVAGATDEDLTKTIRDAVRLNILEETGRGGTMQFTHALVREALYFELPLPERLLLHREIARALQEVASTDPDAVAYHYQQAQDDRALQWLMIAGERAQQLYAWRTAAERFATILTLVGSNDDLSRERAWLSYRIGLLLTYADTETGISRMQDAEQLAGDAGDQRLEAYARADRGLLRCLTGDMRRGLAELRSGVAAIDELPASPEMEPSDDQGRLSVEAIQRGTFRLFSSADEFNVRQGPLVFWLAWAGRYEDALTIGTRFVEEASEISNNINDALGDCLAGLGHAYAALGQPDESLAVFARARDTFGAIDHHFKVGNTAIYELSEAFLPYRADRIMERQWLADQAEAG